MLTSVEYEKSFWFVSYNFVRKDRFMIRRLVGIFCYDLFDRLVGIQRHETSWCNFMVITLELTLDIHLFDVTLIT